MKLFSAFRSMSTLSIALGVSVAIHAALLTVRFVAPEQFNRVFQDTPLEVILVNAHTQERPEKAQAIAQAALAGGGDAAQGRATSPLPYSALTAIGDDFEERQKKLDALQEQQTVLLTQLRKQLAALPEFDPREVSRTRSSRSKSASSSSSCWPKLKSASTKKTHAPRNATSALPRARRCMPSTTTHCAAR